MLNFQVKRRAAAALALVETTKANAYLKMCKEEDGKRKDREQRKIDEYAAHKEKQLAARKARQKEIDGEKQRLRQRMIDQQGAALRAMQEAGDARTESQVLEKQLADEEARLAKENRLRKMEEDVLKK